MAMASSACSAPEYTRNLVKLNSSSGAHGELVAALFMFANCSARSGAIGNGLGDDADVVDSGLPQRIHHRGERSKGYCLVAAQEHRILRFLELGLHLVAEFVDVHRVVAEIDAL